MWPCEWEALSRFAKVDRVILLRRVVPEGGTGFSLNTEPGERFPLVHLQARRQQHTYKVYSCRCWPSLNLSFHPIVSPPPGFVFLLSAISHLSKISLAPTMLYGTLHALAPPRSVCHSHAGSSQICLSILPVVSFLLSRCASPISRDDRSGGGFSLSLIENGSITRLP